ncbi:MAG: gamma-glutamyltransferase, partial [Cyclobacteriaceae bacterium]|nr:gamma-glutamyltransferase [Cyclobacteriaceae bacterium]
MRHCLILSIALLVACQPDKKLPSGISGKTGDSAMVVCAHPLAAAVGKAVLQRGGNAIDAAVAVQLSLVVTFPAAGNIGGGGFLVYRQKDGKLFSLDYREKAPAAAFTDMYLDKDGNVVPNLSTEGHLASGVPGTIDGLVEMHRKFGSLPWKDLVQPAIDLATNGVVLTRREAENLNNVVPELKKYNTVQPEFLYKTWKEGDTVRWAELAQTLGRIRDGGRAGFYEGKTADDLVSEMKRGKGIITHEDLKKYQSRWLEPVTAYYKNYRVISMPPPSSGGVALIQLLKSVEKYPIGNWGYNSSKAIHLMTEAERR